MYLFKEVFIIKYPTFYKVRLKCRVFLKLALNVAFSNSAVFSLIFQGSGLGAGPATVTVLTIYLALLILGNHPLAVSQLQAEVRRFR